MDRHKLEQLRNKIIDLTLSGCASCIRQKKQIMIENFESVLSFALELTEPKPKPQHTIADNYPAGGLTATEPCIFCEDYEQLQTKLDKYRWIPVSERLPEFGKSVYLYIENDKSLQFIKAVKTGYRINHSMYSYCIETNCQGVVKNAVTHWMPIILPEGDNQ